MTDLQPKPRRFQFTLRTLLIVVTLLVIACSGVTYIGQLMPIGRVYSLKAQYSQMPADDSRFEVWLKAQEGIVSHTVHVSRDGNAVNLVFMMVHNGLGKPPFPDLSTACDSLGYKQPVLRWQDNPRK